MSKIFRLLLLILIVGCSGERSRDGDHFFNKQQYPEAIEAYNDYLEAKPNDLKIVYKRGRAYEELGNDDKAVADYNFIISKDSENADAHLGLGGYFYKIDDFENALFHYEHAVKKDRSNVIGFLQKGKTHQKLGNLKEAMADYNSAISIDKDIPDLYVARGSLRLVMNQSRLACNDFKIAKSLGSEESDDIIKQYCR